MKQVILIFILLISTSCTKKHVIHISAKNAVTDEPYAGLKYEVIREHGKTWEEKYIKVASGTLNENGEAVVSKNLIKDPIRVQVEKPANCCYAKNEVYYLKGDGPNYEVAVEFAECAYLKQDIKNINCESPNDVFYIRDKYSYTEWTNYIDLEGCFSNVGGEYSEVPAGTRYFQWKVTRSSGTITGTDTIVFLPGDYKVLTIHY